MASEVISTRAKPMEKIERRHFQKSFHEVYQAASNKSGGRKIRNTMSGLMLITGMPGIKLMPSPPITKKIG
ncbi:hypothetical protein D3C87_1439600 [compost metagenome]